MGNYDCTKQSKENNFNPKTNLNSSFNPINNQSSPESEIQQMHNINNEAEKNLEKLEQDAKNNLLELNKKKEQVEELRKNLELNKSLLAEQSEARLQLENRIKILEQENEKMRIELVNQNKNITQQINEQKNLLLNQNKKLITDLSDLKNKYAQAQQDLQNIQKKYDEIVPITVGLDNIGATCYMNATLQSLSNVPELTNFFLRKYQPNPNKKMSNEYYTVIKNLWDKEKNGKSYSPISFKNVLSEMNPLFSGIAANDSKDLINFLLETFHQELNSVNAQQKTDYMISLEDQRNEQRMLEIFVNDMKSNYNSQISILFYGVLETITTCSNCKRHKYNFQIYSFLEFPLEQVNNYCLQNLRKSFNNAQGIPNIDLYDCFEYYQNPTPMIGDNQIYCNECGKKFDALYGSFLYSMPNYLIINLNRGKNAVYKCNVIFPEILKLYNYVNVKSSNVNTVFQLMAVISHIGPSSMGGHFIAYCRHQKDNCWYKYNDSIVTKCTSHNEYLNGMPYILFYRALDR